jgi:hypothetical protein
MHVLQIRMQIIASIDQRQYPVNEIPDRVKDVEKRSVTLHDSLWHIPILSQREMMHTSEPLGKTEYADHWKPGAFEIGATEFDRRLAKLTKTIMDDNVLFRKKSNIMKLSKNVDKGNMLKRNAAEFESMFHDFGGEKLSLRDTQLRMNAQTEELRRGRLSYEELKEQLNDVKGQLASQIAMKDINRDFPDFTKSRSHSPVRSHLQETNEEIGSLIKLH